MVDSQQAATAAAAAELGYDVAPAVEVAASPRTAGRRQAQGATSCSGRRHRDQLPNDVQVAVASAPPDEPIAFKVRRGGKDVIVETSRRPTSTAPSASASGSAPASSSRSTSRSTSTRHRRAERRPDVLPGHLRHPDPRLADRRQGVAGTGTIDEDGKVGPIGGIQQKIVGARDDGAELFLVPPDNCDEAVRPSNGDMRLVKAVTMHAAVQAIEKWVKDPDAKLPTCRATAERKAEDDGERATRRAHRGRRPRPGRRRARDRAAHRHRRLGPAGPPLRPGADGQLVEKEPVLAHAMGLDEAAAAGSLTPVEQEPRHRRRPGALAGVDHLAARRGRLRGRGGASGAAARGRRERARGPGRRRGVRP